MIRNILWDIDGTILDTKKVFYETLKKAASKKKLADITLPDDLFGLSADQTAQRLGIADRKGFVAYWDKLFRRADRKIKPYCGIEATLHELNAMGIRMAMITSRSKKSTMRLLKRSSVSAYFLGGVTADDTIRHKPDPEPIEHAFAAFDMDPDSTVYIGDTDSDRIAARSAGCGFFIAGWNPDADLTDGETPYLPEELIERVLNSHE